VVQRLDVIDAGFCSKNLCEADNIGRVPAFQSDVSGR
jgi:hypothetical protein